MNGHKLGNERRRRLVLYRPGRGQSYSSPKPWTGERRTRLVPKARVIAHRSYGPVRGRLVVVAAWQQLP